MSETRGKATESPLVHHCQVCGSDRASFGFDLHRGETWFCGLHRAEGVALWSREKAGGAGQR